MRLKVSRGILIASISPTALTVADAPVFPRSPLSPTTVRPREASISARSLLLPPGNPFLTSTVPETSTNKLSCSAPSSMMFSPGPKETGSDASANSSRSSSVRNSKNLTPRSVSSIITSPLHPRNPERDYTPAATPGKRRQLLRPFPRATPTRAIAPPIAEKPEGISPSHTLWRQGKKVFQGDRPRGWQSRGDVGGGRVGYDRRGGAST